MADTPTPSAPEREQPSGIPADAPDVLRKAAAGRTVSPQGELDALEYLLGATAAPEARITVQFETPQGLAPLTFHLRGLDGGRLAEIENTNRRGNGPFAELDDIAANAQIVAEATLSITNAAGRSIDPRSEEFRGDVPDPTAALRGRFMFQSGLIDGVAAEVRRMAGYANDRVGTAQREMVDAVGGS